MKDLDPSIIVAVLSLGGVILGGIGTLVGVFVRGSVETRRIITGAPHEYRRLVDDLQEERVDLRDEVASMRTRIRGLEVSRDADHRLIEGLRTAYVELRRYVVDAGLTPPPVPAGLGIDED